MIAARRRGAGAVRGAACRALPLVVGDGADARAADFLTRARPLSGDPRPGARRRSWSRERRWNLRLKNGIDIRLPEAEPARSARPLLALDRDKKLLPATSSRSTCACRDRVTVRLSDEAAAAARTKR